MAGFTINGFGASDTYHTLKELKTAHCRTCNRETMFSLMELKMKIRLLYIPTVSVGTKYAIACTKCKNGFYVSEEQKNFVLDNPASKICIEAEGVTFLGIDAERNAIEAPEEAETVVVEEASAEPEIIPEMTDAMPVQDVPEQEVQTAPEEAAAEPVKSIFAEKKMEIPVYRPRKICPACRMMFPPEKEVCGICGGTLQEK